MKAASKRTQRRERRQTLAAPRDAKRAHEEIAALYENLMNEHVRWKSLALNYRDEVQELRRRLGERTVGIITVAPWPLRTSP